ncbi:MAG: DMT family transporter [Nitrososphaeria archaeon]|nr:DMT family transporter [Nitrososphaeria archaeon]
MHELVGLFPAICWALSPIFYSRGLRNLNPLLGNMIRALPATAITFLFTIIVLGPDKIFGLPLNSYIVLLLSGVIGLGFGDLFYLLSIKRMGPSPSITISSTYPLITIAFSTLFLGEEINFFVLIGTLLVVLGIAIISRKNGHNKVDFLGVGIATLAAVFWSVSIVLVGSIAHSGHPLAENFWRLMGYVLASFILLLVSKKDFSKPKLNSIFHITLGGIVALNLGWASYIYSIEVIGLSKATTLSSVSPIFTATAEFLIEKRFKLNIFLGTLLTTIGIILVTL